MVNAAVTAAGQLFMEAGQLSMSDFPYLNPKMPITTTSFPMKKFYINSIKNGTPTSLHIALKEVFYVEVVPCIQWTEAKVDTMNKIENLQYVVVGKFTYDVADLEELRLIIPKQLGKPVHLDLATIYKTRPSCARVKVLVDLKAIFPKSVMMDIINEKIGEMRFEEIQIRYDYVPKYCLECNLKGHEKKECQISIKKQEIVVVEKEEEKRDDAMENTGKPERPWVYYFRKEKQGCYQVDCANIPSLVITTNVHERKETGEEIHKKETIKEWINQVFGKTSIDQAKGSNVKEVPANVKNNSNEKQIIVDKTAKKETNVNEVNEATIDNYQSIKQQSAEDSGGIQNECDNEQVNNKEITVFQSHQVVQHTDVVANDKAIIMVPNQTDVIQVISPIRVLHDIMSHNLGEEELLVLEENQATGVSKVEYPNEEMNYLSQEADLSPKLLKSSRKGKQQASGVENQCIRVLSKRNKSKIKF
ncbi:hypothetical protein H5410_028265 [Solanum commersonii]|uniref:Uncharacterized protein n=1 Tax=Solanum commersonii TaxID=4109 RepID=A0A9J5Z3J3_SOLCO|nr:hypothetical protein H5410_028265 [Solanum commersonii]